jgi:hypothetical protein
MNLGLSRICSALFMCRMIGMWVNANKFVIWKMFGKVKNSTFGYNLKIIYFI